MTNQRRRSSTTTKGHNELTERLAKSQAVQSLVSEQRVQGVLRELGWTTQQSYFYRDTVTNKVREMDVVATQFWKSRRVKRYRIARLHLLVEVKSATGFHVVFSDASKQTVERSPDALWLGLEDRATRLQIAKSLEVGGLDADEISSVMGELTSMAYPRGRASIFHMHANAPNAPLKSSAFRETNIGTDKDLDNSVLWRAVQTLESCKNAMKERGMDDALEDLSDEIDLARHLKQKPADIARQWLQDEFR
jgi:hypothetical protein